MSNSSRYNAIPPQYQPYDDEQVAVVAIRMLMSTREPKTKPDYHTPYHDWQWQLWDKREGDWHLIESWIYQNGLTRGAFDGWYLYAEVLESVRGELPTPEGAEP